MTERPGYHPVRLAHALAVSVVPVLVGLFFAPMTFSGTVLPWMPKMVDLDVYRMAGQVVLHGGDIYNLPGSLPFLYPPFAALLAVPLALLPVKAVQIGWTIAGVLTMLAVLHRVGLTGWRLSVAGAATAMFVEPVFGTLAFGQVGTFLMALVFLDLAPGPRVLGQRSPGKRPSWLPQGALTGLAMAIKLTPGIFLLYLLAARRWRAAIGCAVAATGVTLLTLAILPAVSVSYWGGLIAGDTGLGDSIVYYTNQSVLADWARIFGLSRWTTLTGLAASAVVVGLGVWTAVCWHRRGDELMAVVLCGVAGLLGSPVSWSHHFVWVVPMAVIWVKRPLPDWFAALGWIFIGWVAVARFKLLPNGANIELTFNWEQNLLASFTAVLGIAVLIAGLVVARQPQPTAGTGTAH